MGRRIHCRPVVPPQLTGYRGSLLPSIPTAVFRSSDHMRPTRSTTALKTVVVTILVGNVDSPERLFQRAAQVETFIVIDNRARIVAQSTVNLLYAPAEVTHERFRRSVQDSETFRGDEDFGCGWLSFSKHGRKLMSHFQHVFNQVDFDLHGGKKCSICFADRLRALLVQEWAFGSDDWHEADAAQFPHRPDRLSKRRSAPNGVMFRFFRAFEG